MDQIGFFVQECTLHILTCFIQIPKLTPLSGPDFKASHFRSYNFKTYFLRLHLRFKCTMLQLRSRIWTNISVFAQRYFRFSQNSFWVTSCPLNTIHITQTLSQALIFLAIYSFNKTARFEEKGCDDDHLATLFPCLSPSGVGITVTHATNLCDLLWLIYLLL
jgi:hypothetical protein